MLVARGVLFEAMVVGWAVEFNDEFGGGTGEIGEKAVDRVLATKAETFHAMGAEYLP